jgi:4'-phosphopantetheinyl transferase EntD
MITWKIIETIPEDQEVQCLNFAQLVLGDATHPNRLKGFCLARYALSLLLRDRGEFPDMADLALTKPNVIDKYPQFVVSLSHSPQVGAAALAQIETYRSIGIDVELQTRTVKKNILDRISHPADLSSLSPIEKWCLKEAAFKAIMNTGIFSAPVEFSSIELSNKNWKHGSLRGDWDLHLKKDHFVALAWIKN